MQEIRVPMGLRSLRFGVSCELLEMMNDGLGEVRGNLGGLKVQIFSDLQFSPHTNQPGPLTNGLKYFRFLLSFR